MMSKTQDTQQCEKSGDLIAYLYGEANDNERLGFQNHLIDCAVCREELSALAKVREGVVEWRDAALNPMAASAADVAVSRSDSRALSGRSALGALREFFTLSPLWLRGATAFASVLFVALLLVTAFRFFQAPETQVVRETSLATAKKVDATNPVKPEVEEIVAPSPTRGISRKTVSAPLRQVNTKGNMNVAKSNRRNSAPVLSNEELTRLLVAEKEDEESVPRLYDLLSESN